MNKKNFEPVTFSEIQGVRYLHLGTPWVQGAMRIKKPYAIELEYAQQMMSWLLFLSPVNAKTLQLGLGTGTLTQFTNRLNDTVQTTAVELNPAVIVAAQTMFGLDTQSPRMTIIEDNALNYVNNQQNALQFDSVQVDIFNGEASGPALNSLEFYQGCFDVLSEVGVMTVNLFSRHPSFQKNINHICDVFDNRVLLFKEVHDCNVIVIAFKGPHLEISWDLLKQRAKTIQKECKVPTSKWVKQLMKSNVQPKKVLSI
jgi:spermidine synthase